MSGLNQGWVESGSHMLEKRFYTSSVIFSNCVCRRARGKRAVDVANTNPRHTVERTTLRPSSTGLRPYGVVVSRRPFDVPGLHGSRRGTRDFYGPKGYG